MMERRTFLASASAAVVASSAAREAQAMTTNKGGTGSRLGAPFKSAYAPHFGMFAALAGNDPVEQLEFAAGEGFTAWEDNSMASRPIAEQERIAAAMERLNMRMGVFVVNMGTAWNKSFGSGDAALRDKFLGECRTAVEVAKRVNATWMTVVCGTKDDRLHPEVQTGHCIDQLRAAADTFEPHGLVMVIEPLNPYRDHPGMLLSRSTHAYAISRGVNSPACKILFDIYHQQITEGNLIPNIDTCFNEIAYFQIGDNPGRNEPGTGEVNYGNVFGHLRAKGYTGILGMEHGNSQPGEAGARAVIDAYRACDAG
jgi:hydroxypyruvate isomerase